MAVARAGFEDHFVQNLEPDMTQGLGLGFSLVGPEHVPDANVRNMLPDHHGILVSGILDTWKL